MTLKILSTYPPALYRLPGGPLMVTGRLLAGSNIVPEGTTLADLEWSRPALPKPAPARKVMVAGSKAGVTYTVTITSLAKSCSCPAYNFRRTCKHLALAK